MDTNKQQLIQQAGRWLRVGTFALTVLGPIVNAVASRLRESNQPQTTKEQSATAVGPQEKLQAVSAALTEALAALKEHPYSQELRKRGEDITEELLERGSQLSQAVVERGSELSHDLAKRGKRASKALKHQGRATSHTLAEQNSAFWITLGFAVGLVAATIVVFQFVRKRMRRIDEEASLSLAWNASLSSGTLNKPAMEARPVSQPTSDNTSFQPQTWTETPITTLNEQPEKSDQPVIPPDATLVGVISTKRYYSIETPLDQLAPSTETSNIVYFTSEDEAVASGFSPAQ